MMEIMGPPDNETKEEARKRIWGIHKTMMDIIGLECEAAPPYTEEEIKYLTDSNGKKHPYYLDKELGIIPILEKKNESLGID